MVEGLLFKEDLDGREIAPHLQWLLESKAASTGLNDTEDNHPVLTEQQVEFYQQLTDAHVLRKVAEIGLVLHEAAYLRHIARQMPSGEDGVPSSSKLEYDMIRMGQRKRMDEVLAEAGIVTEVDDLEFAERLGGYVAAVRRVAAWTEAAQ